LKEAAEKAVEFEGETFWLPNRKIAFKVEVYKGRKWLAMRLPSGRKIRYFDPKWTPPRESERWINNELVPYTIPGFMDYMGVDTYTRQWMRLQTYGGKLDENADQGFSRDLLCNAMLALDAAGYKIVGSEHDKVILEVPEKTGAHPVRHCDRRDRAPARGIESGARVPRPGKSAREEREGGIHPHAARSRERRSYLQLSRPCHRRVRARHPRMGARERARVVAVHTDERLGVHGEVPVSEQVLPGYMRVITIDGPRKHREYYFKEGTTEFGINSLVPGDVRAAYEGGRLSGYGQYIYKVYVMWGTGIMVGMFDRLAYR
jgi:hypothetical protein